MPVTIDPRRHDAVLFGLDAVVTNTGAPGSGSTEALLRQLRDAGVGTAVFASDRGCADALAAVGLSGLFDVGVDGGGLGLVEAAQRVGARPGRCVVIDDAEETIAAARAGGFALVIGLDATGRHADALRGRGADAVVTELGEVSVRTGDQRMSALPDAAAALLDDAGAVPRPAVFFDFDGTLSDIVDDPDSARLTEGAGEALHRLAAQCPVAVLSGRDLADVRERIGVPGIWYAGSHGFELIGPDGAHHQNDAAAAAIPVLTEAAGQLRAQLGGIAGVAVEHKRFAVAVHYRNAAREHVGTVAAAVRAAGRHYALRVTTGREVIELRPDIDWDKGKTLRWIIERVAAGPLVPMYFGDDITDEDAFDAIRRDGIGIVVRHTDDGDRATAARYALDSPARVREFTQRLADQLRAHRA